MNTVAFMVPGMFSPFINTFLGTYFIDQIEYLEKRGVSSHILPIHTEGTIAINAKIIRDLALKQERIIAFCHSKGGVDLLHALIHYPEIRPHFQKIIFMQCPFFGTPLADLATNGSVALSATGVVFKALLRGDKTAIVELTTHARKTYMETHADEIENIMATLPVACYASSKKIEPGRFDSILKLSRDFIHFRYGLANDGMIPTASGLIPGAVHNSFDDLDHASAVIRLTPQHFDRVKFSHEIFHGVLG